MSKNYDLFENMFKAYGIPVDVVAMIPTPEPQNTQIQIKMEVIDWCDSAMAELDRIKKMFIKAPVDSDSERTELMKAVRDRMRRATIDLEHVIE